MPRTFHNRGTKLRPLARSVAAAPLLAGGGALATMTLYLLGLTAAALAGRRRSPPPPGPAARRFAVLIPAHDEEALIGRLLDSVAEVDYPPDRVTVYVVADNCTDRTEAVSRAHGATVFVRHDTTQQGKGYALAWLLEQLADAHTRPAEDAPDAYVVLDADSVVSLNLLRTFDARLERGSLAVQAYYAVLNASASPLAGLRAAALAAVHYLRPLGRSVLGLSAGLKGNGMCFDASLLRRYGWRWFTLAEDVEFHLTLIRDGVRVDFAPEAVVQADMPVTFGQAASQNLRWERGRLGMVRARVPDVLREGLRGRSALRVDAALEQVIPPLSVPFAAGGALAAAGLVARQRAVVVLAGACLAGQVAYVLAALMLVGAQRRAYAALLYAPLYVAWKVLLYLRAARGPADGPWVRTERRAAPHMPERG